MKTILALPLLALGLAACQTGPAPYGQGSYGYPEPAPYPQPYPGPDRYPTPYPGSAPAPYPAPGLPGGDVRYHAVGTEPFWDLVIARNLVFTDRGTSQIVTEPAPPARIAFAGEIYQGRRINVNIVHTRCSDGMSDRIYPDTVNVTVDGRPYRGCGGSTYPANDAFPTPGAGAGAFNLANTNWRVAAINGQPTPMSGYYFNFMPDRLSGKLGCNSLGGTYSVSGATLTAGALMMTRMACPDGNFETQGAAILAQPMTLMENGDHLTLTNRVGTIELVRAR